jgi:heat shock protein HslJ
MLWLAACADAPDPMALPVAPDSGNANRTSLLASHHWRLTSATDARGQAIPALSRAAGPPIELRFPDGRIEIRGGCNLRGGSYQITATGQLLVGRMITTDMACETALMETDTALAEFFAQPVRFDFANRASPRLRLVSAANEALEFAGRMTPEARYGAPVIAFLEVAPRRVACQHPLVAGARCLQVREVRYDKQGLAVGPPGAWQLLYEDIEGFKHTEGERNVVRVKRFTRNPVPADASATLYVLDLVVESEVVAR